MTRPVVIVYSSFTKPTLVTSMSCQYLAEWLKARDIPVIELPGFGANWFRLSRVMNYMQEETEPPYLVVYMGHGFPKSLVGFEIGTMTFPNMQLIVEGINDDMFKDTIFVSTACWSMNSLGPSMVKKGAITFFGSTKPMLVGFDERDRMYMNDFIDVFTIIPRRLTQGDTCLQALEKYRQLCTGYIKLYSQYPEWNNVDFYRCAMYINLEYYGMIGDGDAVWVE